jgi:chorismate dehydratase
MKPRLGCVPFLNAAPLVSRFSRDDEAEVEIIFDEPSRLGAMVETGELDAAIASSYFVVSDPTLKVAAGVSISSNGPVESVKIFSKKPIDEIQTLALDESSMTSNHLAQIILKKQFGREVNAEPRPPVLAAMLKEFDAAVLIGDRGMLADAGSLQVLDLGRSWRSMTGVPFVWALWVGHDAMTQELSALLKAAKDYGLRKIDDVALMAARDRGIPYEAALHYLSRTIDFELTQQHLDGLRQFGKLCVEMGFVRSFAMPEILAGASTLANSS